MRTRNRRASDYEGREKYESGSKFAANVARAKLYRRVADAGGYLSPVGWLPRAVLGRYLTWLFHFGEGWLREHIANLFPSDDIDLVASAWLGHLKNDTQPVGDLPDRLHPYYAAHIASLGRDDAPPGYEEASNRLVEYLMILYLLEKLPEDVLRQFWDMACLKSISKKPRRRSNA